MTSSIHSAAPHHLPSFIVAPGETDILMVATAVFLLVAVLMAGNLFLWLHTLPERTAHKSQKLQFEIVAILGLLALFTHVHLFWVAALLLAFIDLPEVGKPLVRMAAALERIAGGAQRESAAEMPDRSVADTTSDEEPVQSKETIVRIVHSGGAAEGPPNAEPAPASARS
jgi:hypothetical protein